jgi:drug/metabolite transporter (DMT)-like permease
MGWRNLDSGYLFIFFGILAWASQAFVTKIMVTKIGFFSVYFFASLFSAITAFVFYLILNKGKLNFDFLRHPYKIILISVFLTLANFLLFRSFGLLPATNVIILLYIYPIIMSIIHSIMFKKRLTLKEIVGLTLGFIGIFIFATGGNPLSIHVNNLLADTMVIIAAFSWALYLVIQKRYNFEEFSSNGVAFTLSSLYALPIILIFPSFLPHGLVLPGPNVLILLLYFSIVTFALGNVIYVKGLKKTKIVNTSLLTYLTPLIAIVLDFLFLGEQIFWYDLVPIGLIFIGYVLLMGNKPARK